MQTNRIRTQLTRLFGLLFCASLAACGEQAGNSNPPKATIPLPPAPAFAQMKNCVACHTANAKTVGPSWVSIAEKYKGDKDASAKLSEKILKGGSGSFGAVVMPAQGANLTPDEAKYLAEWVLGQK